MKFEPKSILSSLNLNPRQLWLGAIAVTLLLLITILIIRFVFGAHSRIEEALLTGQRLEIILETGETRGKILTVGNDAKTIAKESDYTIEESKTKDAQPGHTSTVDTHTDNTPLELEKEEEIKEKIPAELAWTQEDFIGPKLPEDIIDAFFGKDRKKVNLKFEKISISDLGDKPIIIVIIKGLGLSASTTEQALELPKNITLGFSPYSPSLEDWVVKAQEKEHEFILNIPMETENFNINDPGPYALATKTSKEDNITRLKMLLSLVKGYKAVYSEKEEVFTRAANSVRPILTSLKNEGKYFIYGGGYENFSLIQIADEIEYPMLVNDILLDDEISADGINRKLREIEKTAKEKGYVVVMAHPYPITIRMLERWLPQVEARGIKIAPVSVLLGKIFIDD